MQTALILEVNYLILHLLLLPILKDGIKQNLLIHLVIQLFYVAYLCVVNVH
nr:MAG TPA: hypothetical protein [Caudoviricetes sp.]